MFDIQTPRRKLRLPQLAKFNRRQRKHGVRSEFISMCERVALSEQMRHDRTERLRREIASRAVA